MGDETAACKKILREKRSSLSAAPLGNRPTLTDDPE